MLPHRPGASTCIFLWPALFLHPGSVEKLLWGGKVRGLRVTLRKAKKPVVAGLLQKAWLRKAPKALAAKVRHSSGTMNRGLSPRV